ncbi:hypothetical protein Holit_02987 [Hollandina sp. SP2]
MKKFIALSAVLVILAGTGFAQLTVKGEANVALAPLVFVDNDSGDDNTGTAFGRNGNNQSETKLYITGEAEKVGFRFDWAVTVDKSAPTLMLGDFAEVWIKPIDALRIDAGRFNVDTLRGKIGDGGLKNYTVNSGGADDIFTRFKGENALTLSLTPIQGLFVGVQLNKLVQWKSESKTTPNHAISSSYWKTDGTTDGYQNIQIAAGYEIAGVGLARIQFIGAEPLLTMKTKEPEATPKEYTDVINASAYHKIEGAFAYTGMSGLILDVGAKIPLAFKEYKSDGNTQKIGNYQAPFQASLGVQYGSGALTVPVRVDAKFAGITDDTEDDDADAVSEPFILNAHLWPSYKVLENTTVGIDFGLEFIGETAKDGEKVENKDGGMRIGFGAWLEQSYGPGSVKVGLAYRLAGEVDKTKEPGVFTIPVIFKAAF